MRIPVIERDAYTVWLQPYEDRDEQVYLFIHCELHTTWTATIKRRLARDYANLRDMVRRPFFTLSDPKDTKHHKFLGIFGFYHFKDIKLGDASVKHIYKSEK